MATGIERIAEKRRGHLGKGWTPEHDDQHRYGELSIAAAELAVHATDAKIRHPDDWRDPWGLVESHPDRVEQLAIAGALIAAEIDRELRLLAMKKR